LLAAIIALSLSLPSCTTRSSELEAVIAAKVKELGGRELCQCRMYDTLADLDSDGTPDFVAVFGIEDSRDGPRHIQFMVVFVSSNPGSPVITEVGRVGQRVVTRLEVWSPDIVLHVLEYGPSDAVCCPGDVVVIGYRRSCGGLQQVMHSSTVPHHHPPVESPCGPGAKSEHP
jgi:hypothetical protein